MRGEINVYQLHTRLGHSSRKGALSRHGQEELPHLWHSATSKKTGVRASIRYASEDLAKAFEELSGVTGRLFISLQPDKQIPRDESLKILFSTAKTVLLRTECDAAFNLEWDHVILRRIRGEIAVEDISHLFPHDSDALLQQLDMSDAPRQKSK